jgi:uncharacterized protein YecT (DUF1311 family)
MTTKRIVLNGMFAVFFLPNLSSAATHATDEQTVISHLYGLRPSYAQCLDKASSATATMRTCMTDELAYQDKRLNEAYRALMAKLSAALQSKLKAEENVWIQYRNNRCATVLDGLERPELDALSCKVDETGKQASDLEARLFVQ